MSSLRPGHPARFLGSSLAASIVLLVSLAGCSDPEAGSTSSSGGADPLGLGSSSGAAGEEELQAPQLYIKAREAAQAGDEDKAVELYRRVVELEPNVPDARFSLGTLLVPMASAVVLGSSTIDYEVLDEALEHLDHAVELDPENANYLYWLGRALDIRGNEAGALERLQKAVLIDPGHAKAHKRIGMVHVERGEMDEAERYFLKALELWPGDAGVHYQLGNLALDGDPEKARDYYLTAIDTNPKLASSYHGLSQALAQLGDAEGAEQARLRAEKLQSERDTLAQIEQLADAKPADLKAQFDAAQANFVLHKYTRAQTHLARVLQLQPDHAEAHYYMGLIRMEEEDWTMAMNHVEESLYYSPEKIGPRAELIRIYLMLKNAERVEELALELEVMMDRPGIDAETRCVVAEVFLEIGRTEKAKAYLNSVLAEDSGNEVATILLERAESGE